MPDINHIAEIVQGSFLQLRRNDRIEHLLLDSRRLIFPDTSLFFSLRGPRRDGSQFLDELYHRGVRNFVIQDDQPHPENYPDANIIRVGDTLLALQELTAWRRQQFSIPVIGITGSNGKTIVKEWLNQLLENKFHIVRSPKSYNSQIGVPLSVWQMNAAHELAIFEAGISRRGEMARLEAIIRPTIGIFTNIGEAHSEGFHDLQEKALEKWKLFDRAEAVIFCHDQPATAKALAHWRQHRNPSGPEPLLFSWGHSESSILRIISLTRAENAPVYSTVIKTRYRNQDLDFNIPFTDDASIENIMHCICTLLYLGLDPVTIRGRLQELMPIAMRLELKSGINHCSIINDSYSADLSSLQIALDFLAQQRQHNRRTVILSDILESGRTEEELYGEVALALRQKKVDRLIGIGGRISAQQAIFRHGFPGELVFYPSVEQFRHDFHQLHFRDETILIKGARIFEFEDIDRLLSEQIHQTLLEINLDAMSNNLRQYRQILEPGVRVMAMVKAFAYGSGSFEIANLLQFHRIDYLGVAYADEGVTLRRGGIGTPIMVMNTEDSSFDALVQYNLEPVIYSMRLLRTFEKWLRKEGILSFPVHIEIETGMNRLGFPLSELEELARALSKAPFKVQSVFSHLAASEEAAQDGYTQRQAEIYVKAADRLQQVLPYPFLRHIGNSAAIIRHPELHMDMVRLGIGLYGIDSANAHILNLREVSTLKSTIAQIKHLKAGETVGYNRRGVADKPMTIATVRIGYADGYPRSLGNGAGKMWVRGRLAPVVGSVCMDMTMIDVTGITDLKDGDEVIIFGNELSVSQLADWAHTIPYEILTGVSQRVKRIYFEE